MFVLMTLVITSLSFTGEHYANMNSNHDKLALQSTSSVTNFDNLETMVKEFPLISC